MSGRSAGIRANVRTAVAVTGLLLLVGCSSGGHPRSAGDSAAPAANGSAPGAAPSQAPPPGGGPGGGPDGTGASPGGPGASASPQWQVGPLPGSTAVAIRDRLAAKFGLEFHQNDYPANAAARLPQDTEYGAAKQMPDGFRFSVLIQQDTEGRPRIVMCQIQNSLSEQAARTLAGCLDGVLGSKVTEQHRTWISQQLADARSPSGTDRPPTPAPPVEGGIVLGLSPTLATTYLQIRAQATS
ncbi:hypothetical protein [Kitasatospora sp. NPDC088134]|uniref:hypothetical protein n=1 Tax=Kitasatospora sp. NPDC088134 TaxID=3364071 RepID=UPI003822ED09